MASSCCLKVRTSPLHLSVSRGGQSQSHSWYTLGMNLTKINTYHLVIVSFYFLVYVCFFAFVTNIPAYFAFKPQDVKFFLLGFLITLSFLFVINSLVKFGLYNYQKKSVKEFLLLFIYATFLIAIPEEILFRGIIQNNLQSMVPATEAIILSSLLFGIAHLKNRSKGWLPSLWNWKLISMTFSAGLVLGSLFFITKSLIMPIILHTLLIIGMKLTVREKF